MPSTLANLRYPHERVFLPRTRLAYVHLHNLLTDAKRDRAARVFGYVAIWLPEEMVVLYLQEGELVNATVWGPHGWRGLPIADALALVPPEPEYGEICFHEADDEQLACMHFSQVTEPEPWPDELVASDPGALFPYLMSTTFDGVVEVVSKGQVSYLIFRDGAVERGFLKGVAPGALVDGVQQLFVADPAGKRPVVRRWPVPPALPVQAPPALVQVYRQLVNSLVQRLLDEGNDHVHLIADYARHTLIPRHPALASFAVLTRASHDPVADADALTAAVAAWIGEITLAAVELDSEAPDRLLRELTWERRHVLQSAGFFDQLAWTID